MSFSYMKVLHVIPSVSAVQGGRALAERCSVWSVNFNRAFILISSFGHNCRACDCYQLDIRIELSAWELEPMGWGAFCLALAVC
jgi:hypothetical protein